MSPQRCTAWGVRLLLFSALLFGVAAMHTIGHPTGHGGGHSAGHSQSQSQSSAPAPAPHGLTDAADHHGTAVANPSSTGHGPALQHGTADRPSPGEGGADPAALTVESADHPAQSGDRGEPLGGMDPGMDTMSVCLAVLSTFSALTLLTSGLLAADRQRARQSLAAALARAHRAMPAHPPPRSAYSGYLTQLSVLRL